MSPSPAAMLLFEPPPSPGDLHFRVLGIPVRVHPFFWVTTLIMGLSGKGGTPPAELIIWIVVVFGSILVHELGHALMQRRFGGHPWITLHGIGGLASCDDGDSRPMSRILILLAGPGAGFALAASLAALMRLSGHYIGWTWASEIPWEEVGISRATALSMLGGKLFWEPFASQHANTLLADLLQVNILWGLINLLPVYPLDGGQIMREVCTLRSPRQGIVLSLRISMVAGIATALAGLFFMGSWFVPIMFGYLAYTSYRTLEAYQANRW
jgi:stage IV sporulation protein FB